METAIQAFERNGFFVFVGDRQVDDLDEELALRTTTSSASRAWCRWWGADRVRRWRRGGQAAGEAAWAPHELRGGQLVAAAAGGVARRRRAVSAEDALIAPADGWAATMVPCLATLNEGTAEVTALLRHLATATGRRTAWRPGNRARHGGPRVAHHRKPQRRAP